MEPESQSGAAAAGVPVGSRSDYEPIIDTSFPRRFSSGTRTLLANTEHSFSSAPSVTLHEYQMPTSESSFELRKNRFLGKR